MKMAMEPARDDKRDVPMDILAMLAGAGITAGSGLIGKALGFWHNTGVSKIELELRLSQMKSEWERTNKELEKTGSNAETKFAKTISEHQALLLMVTELQARQNVTNQVVIDGMKSLNAKMESHDIRFLEMEHQSREIQTTQAMIREILQEVRSQKEVK